MQPLKQQLIDALRAEQQSIAEHIADGISAKSSESYSQVPRASILAMGSGLVGQRFSFHGYLPAKPDERAKALRTRSGHRPPGVVAHGHTYEAHPLTLAPAVAAIREYKRLGLIERARTVGAQLGERLRGLANKHPSVGDVRGLGMFWAIELVENRDSRKPFNTPDDKVARKPMVVDAVTAKLMELGVFCMGWISHLVIAPPLTIDDAGIDEAAALLARGPGSTRIQRNDSWPRPSASP